jgi:nitrate/nitrite transporter NarK
MIIIQSLKEGAKHSTSSTRLICRSILTKINNRRLYIFGTTLIYVPMSIIKWTTKYFIYILLVWIGLDWVFLHRIQQTSQF